jgi:hypothetical protein
MGPICNRNFTDLKVRATHRRCWPGRRAWHYDVGRGRVRAWTGPPRHWHVEQPMRSLTQPVSTAGRRKWPLPGKADSRTAHGDGETAMAQESDEGGGRASVLERRRVRARHTLGRISAASTRPCGRVTRRACRAATTVRTR